MSDTPRTDAECAGRDKDPVMAYEQILSLARHLECELGEVTAERDAHMQARGQINGLKARIAELACERDMLKSEIVASKIALSVSIERAERAEDRLAVMRTMAVLWERMP